MALETPTGTLGTDTDYVLAFTPVGGKVEVFLDGLVQDPALYTVTGDTITFGTAPIGTTIFVSYFKT